MLSYRQIEHDGIYWAISRRGTGDSRQYGSYRADRGVIPVPVMAQQARDLLALGLVIGDARKVIPVREGNHVRFQPVDGLPYEIRDGEPKPPDTPKRGRPKRKRGA